MFMDVNIEIYLRQLKEFFKNDEEARKIADRGFTKLLQYHTTQQRASQFLSLIVLLYKLSNECCWHQSCFKFFYEQNRRFLFV